MKNYKASFFALFLFLVCGVYTQACEIFQEANQAYFQGDFQTAIDKYEQCEKKSFEVLYNLGNAYFKEAQLGKSIQYYRKAQQLNPEDENLRYNLEFASKQTVDEEDYDNSRSPRKILIMFFLKLMGFCCSRWFFSWAGAK